MSGKSSVSRMIISVVKPVGTDIPNIGHLIKMSAISGCRFQPRTRVPPLTGLEVSISTANHGELRPSKGRFDCFWETGIQKNLPGSVEGSPAELAMMNNNKQAAGEEATAPAALPQGLGPLTVRPSEHSA